MMGSITIKPMHISVERFLTVLHFHCDSQVPVLTNEGEVKIKMQEPAVEGMTRKRELVSRMKCIYS